MTITMHNTRQLNIPEMEQVLEGAASVSFDATDKREMYAWIETTLRGSGYLKRTRAERGIIRRYIMKMTGLGASRTAELIAQFRNTTRVQVKEHQRHTFSRTYQPDDIALLADADTVLHRLNGPATAEIFRREYEVFGKVEYQRLANISSSHIYNLRGQQLYRDKTKLFAKTAPVQTPIGERTKPDPNGKPGYIRVDCVHQGDSADGEKGLYSVNLVCEETQFEIATATEKISEQHMVPVLEAALEQFPFEIVNFHADNGGEFINSQVAGMLDRMLVKLTKSRARKSNDNALVESKNGAIVRKYLGHMHIAQEQAGAVDAWYRTYLNPFVNFHRPCAFGKEVVVDEHTGKRKRIYPHGDYRTPYEKLKSLKDADQYLRDDISFEQLDKQAYAESDIDAARKLEDARDQLFKIIHS